MSCLQSRTQDAAFTELTRYPVDGVQLTPGNLPSAGFRDRIRRYAGEVRYHHGFAWDAYRRRVYDEELRAIAIGPEHSVHPPRTAPDHAEWLTWAARKGLLVETMYPGSILGTGAEIGLALDLGLRLAVDVSHLFIQRTAGVLGDGLLRRLLESSLVREVHVSSNNGLRDQHCALTQNTYLLDWARERSAQLPVVLESYWHRANEAERLSQLELLLK